MISVMTSEYTSDSFPARYYMAVPCEECGNEIHVGRTTRHLRLCEACKLSKYEENLRSLMEKRGPAYDRYREAQRAGYERWRRGGGGGKNKSDPSKKT